MQPTKKPNIRIPEGFNLVWNDLTNMWALRPIKGYSSVYLKKTTFVPQKESQPALFSPEETKTESIPTGTGKNSNLRSAKREKNDEFYTPLEAIVDELKHYEEFFKGKVVYCPCDKVYNLGRSNFFTYFASKFHKLGIKKLICTQYNPTGRGTAMEYDFEKAGIKWEYNGEYKDGEDIDESMVDTYFLNGDGSFNSGECRTIMSQCDIVVTNPPFSMFREFVGQIMDLGKKFLIIGSMNAITYKETFSLIKENKIWLGYNQPKYFEVPLTKVENEKIQYEEDGKIYQKFGNICWFTNLPHKKRSEELEPWKSYTASKYPKYDNYDAIEVSKVAEIPCDYKGVMGVPITFLFSYCPTEFEIVGGFNGYKECDYESALLCGTRTEYVDKNGKVKTWTGPTVNRKTIYFRILIRRK